MKLESVPVETIYFFMSQVPDYRSKRKKTHVLAEMLTYLVCAYICGRTSVGRALKWAQNHLGFLRKFMPLIHGIASEATISRMLSHLDEEMMELMFIEWSNQIVKLKNIQLCIDGKALRAGTRRVRAGNTPYVLNVIEVSTRMVLAQLAIDTKTNEITAIPRALELLNLRDRVITIDSAGTHLNIMEMIVNAGGHYVLPIKKNNRIMYNEILKMFPRLREAKDSEDQDVEKQLGRYLKCYTQIATAEKNRERYEYRTTEACGDATFLSPVLEKGEKAEDEEGNEIPDRYIKSAALYTNVRVPIEKAEDGTDITVSLEEFLEHGSHRKPSIKVGDKKEDDVERVGAISDQILDANEFAQYRRDHWAIENSLHYVLDMDFAEDRSPAKGSRNNLAIIRKYAYNVLRLAIRDTDPKCLVREMMDRFADNVEMLGKYVFSPVMSIVA